MSAHNSTLPDDNDSLESAGLLLLRLTIGGLMLFHGIAKLQNGVGVIEGMLEDSGLPAIFAYGVYVGEVIAPLLIIAGLLTRVSSLVFAFNMIVAIGLGHRSEIFTLGPHGGWAIELQMLYLLGALSIAFLGPGKFAVPPRRGLWA